MKIAKNQGTALLITILLAGAISAVSFGIFKIASSEVFVGTKEEEGLEAYYVAQAGVEDALLRFKFKEEGNLEMPDGATEDSTRVARINVNTDNNQWDERIISNINTNYQDNLNLDENTYIYDLKVWYKARDFQVQLDKDESVVFDVSDIARENQRVIVRWTISGPVNLKPNTKLWYRLSNPANGHFDPRGLDRDFFTYLAYYNENQNPAQQPGQQWVAPLRRAGVTNYVDLHGFGTMKFKAFCDEGIKINVTIESGDADHLIGGPYAYIESTGYYGNTARKITAKVDRASKSVLDIFDYVIYSGEDQLP